MYGHNIQSMLWGIRRGKKRAKLAVAHLMFIQEKIKKSNYFLLPLNNYNS